MTCCILIYTTPADAVENVDEFVEMMQDKVIYPLRTWTKEYSSNYDQFGVLLMMGSNTDWASFEPLPKIRYNKYDHKAQPIYRMMDNYYAALPKDSYHSEERVLGQFTRLLRAYQDKHGTYPEAIVLYTYFLPCYYRFNEELNSCTSVISNFVTDYEDALSDVDFFVAYSDDRNLEFNGCSCNKRGTNNEFYDKYIDHIKVPYDDNDYGNDDEGYDGYEDYKKINRLKMLIQRMKLMSKIE